MTEMNKNKFLKFMVDEIERNQKEMYANGEGKKVVSVLIQIYTLVSDGKFDFGKERVERISNEIESFSHGHAIPQER